MGFEFNDPRANRKGWEDREGDVSSMTPEQEERLAKILNGWHGEAIAVPIGTTLLFTSTIHIQLAEGGQLPTRALEGDAGYDLYVAEPARVPIDGITDLHTNISIALPPGYFGRITGRSSTLRKRGLLVNEGIVDSGYRGELFVAVFNLGQTVATVERGDRIAQLLVHRIETIGWRVVEQLPSSERGRAGFGSTGR